MQLNMNKVIWSIFSLKELNIREYQNIKRNNILYNEFQFQ